MAAEPAGHTASPWGLLADLATTGKPRVTLLAVATAWAGWALAGGGAGSVLAATLVGTGLTVAGAGALNNYLERDLDGLMARTQHRPLPAGRLSPAQVLGFALALVTAGVAVLLLGADPASAALAAAGVLYYVVVYTLMLKPRSPGSAVPGSLAGVAPPLIGWAATGRPWSMAVGLLCVVVFLWSPPHFWSLALVRRDDYARAGIPAAPLAWGEGRTRLEILAYSLALLATSLLSGALGGLGWSYLLLVSVAGGAFVWFALRLVRERSDRAAWLVYRLSGPYLALLVAAMIVASAVHPAFDRIAGLWTP